MTPSIKLYSNLAHRNATSRGVQGQNPSKVKFEWDMISGLGKLDRLLCRLAWQTAVVLRAKMRAQ